MPSLQLSDSISSSPAEQGKAPAELGLTNFVIHIWYKMIVPQSQNCSWSEKSWNQRQIDEKSGNSRPQSPFLLIARVCLPDVTWVQLVCTLAFTHAPGPPKKSSRLWRSLKSSRLRRSLGLGAAWKLQPASPYKLASMQICKMGLTYLLDSRCVLIVLIKAFIVLLKQACL